MTAEIYPTTTALVIAGVTILQDTHGRYNLNTFHQASVSPASKSPGQWLKRKTTQELISELDSQMSFSTSEVVVGGHFAGTYVHELLAVSYAGWISPTFQLRVNQAFLDMKRGTPHIPQVRDPAIQMLIDMAVHLDEARTVASEAKQLATVANTKADMAIANQQWLTVRKYVFLHDLERQMPPSACKAYGTFLTGYCLENGIPVDDQPVADRQWDKENSYYAAAIAKTLPGWLIRQHGQAPLAIVTREGTP